MGNSRDANTMNELAVLHESTVEPKEIDHLGHLNVRFYATRALRATKALAEQVGLTRDVLEQFDAELLIRDVFTRHYREQLVGSQLNVRGGVLEADASGFRFYHELFNIEKDELAATFVHRVELRRGDGSTPVEIPGTAVEAAMARIVEWPDHGRPRSIDLDSAPVSPGLGLLLERGLAMREERIVDERLCDSSGLLKPSAFMDLLWGGAPTPEEAQKFLLDLPNGHKFGWATMESRASFVERPRVGARTRAFGAEVEIGRKISYRHQWLIDLDTERLLFRFSMINLAFDINERRSIEVPEHIRASMQREFFPDLR